MVIKTLAIPALLLLFINATPTFADCVDYHDYLHWVGRVDTQGACQTLVVSGSYAYVANGFAGLEVLDISNPGSPSIVANVGTSDFSIAVAVSGSHAYV